MNSQGTTLLANDWDPEGQSLTASLVSSPTSGTVTNFGSGGTFTYTPNPGFVGFDTFTYKVSDGSVDSEAVEVTIAVGGDLTPRTNQDRLGSANLPADGIVTLSEPLTAGLGLLYNSATIVDPIIAVDTGLKSSASVPSSIDAQLTFGGSAGSTYSYSTTGLNAGDGFRVGLSAPASSLSTGRYSYSLKVTTGSTDHTFTGSTNLVRRNSASEPFGKGCEPSTNLVHILS